MGTPRWRPHLMKSMNDQDFPLSVAVAFFFLGTMFGRRMLLLIIPEQIWKNYTVSRLMASLPEIRSQIDKFDKVDWMNTRYISVMNSDVGVVGVVCNNQDDKGQQETKVYLKNFNGRWEQI